MTQITETPSQEQQITQELPAVDPTQAAFDKFGPDLGNTEPGTPDHAHALQIQADRDTFGQGNDLAPAVVKGIGKSTLTGLQSRHGLFSSRR